MKREFLEGLSLEGGAKLSKEAVEAIMAEYGKEKTGFEHQITTLTSERDGLQSQLTEANTAIQSYKEMDIDGIKAKAGEWETKYQKDTQELKNSLEEAKYGFAVKEAVSGLKFTSESARKAFLADLTEKKLPVQEGKLLGLEDFAKNYRESDPGAFAPDTEEKTPVFTRGGTGGGPALGTDAALRAAFGLTDTTKKE